MLLSVAEIRAERVGARAGRGARRSLAWVVWLWGWFIDRAHAKKAIRIATVEKVAKTTVQNDTTHRQNRLHKKIPPRHHNTLPKVENIPMSCSVHLLAIERWIAVFLVGSSRYAQQFPSQPERWGDFISGRRSLTVTGAHESSGSGDGHKTREYAPRTTGHKGSGRIEENVEGREEISW